MRRLSERGGFIDSRFIKFGPSMTNQIKASIYARFGLCPEADFTGPPPPSPVEPPGAQESFKIWKCAFPPSISNYSYLNTYLIEALAPQAVAMATAEAFYFIAPVLPKSGEAFIAPKPFNSPSRLMERANMSSIWAPFKKRESIFADFTC